MKTLLELQSVTFNHASQKVLKGISLQLQKGEISCLLGPSGCGKTSLIRLIAGFNQPGNGQVLMNGEIVANAQFNQPPQVRNIGMVFQDLTLFPHLDVKSNIAFGLGDWSDDEKHKRVQELLQLCKLTTLADRYPHQISGGQQQRVALARALAPKPQLLLLDEPFSSIDSSLQRQLAQEVKEMLMADQATAVWVTHDLQEAFSVADQIGLMIDGHLQQWSTPQELYYAPNNDAVVDFLNLSEWIDGQQTDGGAVQTELGVLRCQSENHEKTTVKVMIHKQDFKLNQQGTNNATLMKRIYCGGAFLISVKLLKSQKVVSFTCSDDWDIAIGEDLCIGVREKKYRTYPVL